MNIPFWLGLVILAFVAFLQNMAFTWVSRSRNSGDPEYHRYAAWSSSGIWFVTTLLIWNALFSSLTAGEWWKIVLTGFVYVIATTEGSVAMMKILLKTETGKRKVGSGG